MKESGGGLTPQQQLVLEVDKHMRALKNGASWFYWIAGLSVLNSVIQFFQGEWGFVVGLGMTQIIDAFAAAFVQEFGDSATFIRVIALVIDVLIAGVFVFFGWFANRRMGWAFGIGMTLYALDGLLFLLVQDWLSLAFHVFALFGLLGGYGALRKLRELEVQISDAATDQGAV